MAGATYFGARFSRIDDCCRSNRSMVTIDLAINRTMQTYAMITDHLTASQECFLKTQLISFLYAQTETDEMRLTVAGLTFLRQLSPTGR
jgi:hypothetical protein